MTTSCKIRFIVDTNVGHLVPKLRMLGCDALFPNPIDDSELIRIAERDGRAVISADRRLFERRPFRAGRVRGLLIDTDEAPATQLRRIIETFGLASDLSLIRCLACNTLLVARSKEEARESVPPYVYRTCSAFAYCATCDQFFWEGDHVKRMRAFIEKARTGGGP